MKRRLLSLLLTLAMLFTMVPMMGIGVGAKVVTTPNPMHNIATSDCDLLPYAAAARKLNSINYYVANYNFKTSSYGYIEVRELLKSGTPKNYT